MTLRSRLYIGQVFHKRMRPKVHVLRYSVFSMLLDLTELQDLADRFWLFSHNRFNLLSFHDKDFGDTRGENLIDFVNRNLRKSGIHTMPTRIWLSCYPRVLGHAFNPLSLFYCMNNNDVCYAIIHEVHNTFGERHTYVLPVDEKSDSSDDVWINQSVDKALFVSPFAHMGMSYEFRLNVPGDKQVAVIRASDDQGLVITASYVAHRSVLTTSQLLKVFFRIPLLGAKVVSAIHWEALKLWLKGVPWFKHQPKRST